MIIKVRDGRVYYEARSDKPGVDWTGEAEHVIDERDPTNAELIEKIKKLAPFAVLVYGSDGRISDAVDDAEARAEWEKEHPKPTSPVVPVPTSLDERVTELEAALELILSGVVE